MNRKKTGQLLELKKQDVKDPGEVASEGQYTQTSFDPYSVVPDLEFKEIQLAAQEFTFQDVRLIRTMDVVVAQWVGLKCRYGCANYNTSWCCPPAAPDMKTTQALLSEYQVALLLIGESQNEQFHRNITARRRLQVKRWKGTVALERKLFLKGYYKAFGMPAETCALCKRCSYPDQCKFPNEKRPSIEACSIDMFATIRQVGQCARLALDDQDTYDSYSLILLV